MVVSKRVVPARTRNEVIPSREFEDLVRDAVKGIPSRLRKRLENINIVVQGEPTSAQKKAAGMGKDEELLGLYEGVPLGERTHFYGSVLPDKITVFRGPVTRSCRSRRDMRQAVRDTVLHEIAHYFGLSDAHMIEDGTY